MMDFEFTYSCCGEIHNEIPSFGVDAPIYFYDIPNKEREERTFLTTDICVIDDEDFYVKGCLEMPIIGSEDIFSFNGWISLSEDNFFRFQELLEEDDREDNKPMVGWFSSWIFPFEETEKLKAKIHFRNNGIRPFIELESTEHPLALAQKNGISIEQIKKIYEYYVHGKEV